LAFEEHQSKEQPALVQVSDVVQVEPRVALQVFLLVLVDVFIGKSSSAVWRWAARDPRPVLARLSCHASKGSMAGDPSLARAS
jgi:hypothetical protein